MKLKGKYQQTSPYWPNTASQYCFAHRISIGPVPFYSIGPVQGQYWADTGPVPICLYWPSIGPIPHIRYWASTGPILEQFFCIGPVQARYRASTDFFVLAQYWTNTAHTILAQYRLNTGPIPGQHRFLCTGPVLDQ